MGIREFKRFLTPRDNKQEDEKAADSMRAKGIGYTVDETHTHL